MHGSRGCLGCCDKSEPITSLDQQPDGLSDVGQRGKKPRISENLWTASTCDMDNSAVQSQGSMSSISLVNHIVDPHGVSGSNSNSSEFVNNGLLQWNQMRHNWVGNKKRGNRVQHPKEPKLNWNATYDSLLGTNKPFPQRIPLSEMVDFLVDVWEQEVGMLRTTVCSGPTSHFLSGFPFLWNATYDSLLGTNKPFPQRIPLSEMVDFLVDVWEQEGMYA